MENMNSPSLGNREFTESAPSSDRMSAQAHDACPVSKPARIASWVLQIGAAVVLGQTLFFKFSGAEEPVYIFTTLGVEPWGRYAAALSELIAVVLLLIPRTVPLGAMLSVGVMVGALGAHLGPLGIEVKNDGGLLFALGIVVLLAALGILALRRSQVMGLITGVFRLVGVGSR